MDISSRTLCELHRMHRQLAELRSRLKRGPRQAAAAADAVAERQRELDRAKQAVTRSRVAADQKELQLKERENRIEDLRRKLNGCSSNREYQALMEQIAADEQANSVLSDEILELYDRVSAEQEAVKKAEETVAASQTELEKIRTRVDGERDSLESDLGRLTQQLHETENQLPEELRPEYDRSIKSRSEQALAPLEDGYCGGCFQQTTSQMLNELKLSKLVLCKSCGRILYLPEETQADRP